MAFTNKVSNIVKGAIKNQIANSIGSFAHNLVAGNNLTIKAGNRILLKSNVADCDALRGNLAPRDVTFLGQVYGGSKLGIDKIPTGGLIS